MSSHKKEKGMSSHKKEKGMSSHKKEKGMRRVILAQGMGFYGVGFFTTDLSWEKLGGIDKGI